MSMSDGQAPMTDDEAIAWVREGLQARRQQVEARGADQVLYLPGAWQPESRGSYSPALYLVLNEVNQRLVEIADVRPILRPSPLPLIGRWVDRLKSPLHDLVLVYIRELARRLVEQQRRLVRVLNEAVDVSGRSPTKELDSLRARLDQVERELAELRAQPGDRRELSVDADDAP